MERSVCICSQWSSHAPCTRLRKASVSGVCPSSPSSRPSMCLWHSACNRSYTLLAMPLLHISCTAR
eukprot:scaffold12665_cov69-Phaeocystis_antarctica.AAC.2